MTSAGNVNEAIQALETLQKKTDKTLSFLKMDPGEDRMAHVAGLRFHMKGIVNNIFYSGAGVRNYPCITKIFELASGTVGAFPKEKAHDPVTCAKTLYVLCNNYPDKSMVENIKDVTFRCKAQCDICYRLAFEEYYRHGLLKCKKS